MSQGIMLKRRLQRYNQVFMLGAVVVIAIIMTKGIFLRPSNLMVIVAGASVFGLLSLGQGLVVISGGFDLSVGSLIAFAISWISMAEPNLGLFPACISAIVVTTGLGSLNGLLAAHTNIPPFIITLGMLSVAKSFSWMLMAGKLIIMVKGIKEFIQPLFAWMPMGVNAFPVLILGLGSVFTGLLLHRTVIGRYIYAIGGNEKAALASGLPVKTVKIFVYTVSGFLCGIGANVYLYRNSSASPGSGEEFLLQTFAATMVGGVYMYGGEGTIFGILVGIFSLASITSVLTVAGVAPVAHKAVLGVIILGVVLLQRWLKEE
jgi:ribose/xylose/arabinose/galactoside ABC-type transport system permease subunit